MANVRTLTDCLVQHSQFGAGEIKQMIRAAQDAGLLPKAKRGGSQSMPPLTTRHCVDVIFAMAGMTQPGGRTASGAREAVRRFRGLKLNPEDPDERRSTLADDFAQLIESRGVYPWEDTVFPWRIKSLMLVNNPERPEAEIVFFDTSNEAGGNLALKYRQHKPDYRRSALSAALFLDGMFLSNFAGMLLNEEAPR